MIVRTLCYLFLLVITTWLGLHLSQNPGYILISYSNINIETSLWFGILAIMAIFIAIYLIIASLQSIWHGISWLGKSSGSKKLELAISAITAASYKNWQVAEKSLRKYNQHDIIASIALILVKSQYDLPGSISEIEKIYLKYPAHKKFILLIKANIYFSHQKYNDAIYAIERLNHKDRNADCFNYLLVKCYYKLESYSELKELLPKCKKILSEDDYNVISIYYYKKSIANNEIPWHKVPVLFQQEPECLSVYIKELISKQEKITAKKLLVKHIAYSWDEDLIRQYVEITTKAEAITQLTKWHEQNTQEPKLLVILAELHIEHQALAVSFYQKALAIGKDNKTLLAAISHYLAAGNVDAAQKLINKF